MNDWKTVRLGDMFDLQMGKTPDRKNLDFFSTTDNKWISIADISKADKYITETKEYISDEAVKKSGIKQIPANTVIMSFKLSIGKTVITKEPMYSNEAIMAFFPNGKYEVDNDFIYHLFSNKDWSEGSNKAVKGITLNKASLLEATIQLPPLAIQKQIAKVMDKCTEIISKNEKMLQNYDSLIKSRFIEMFGDPVTNPMKWEENSLDHWCTKITDGTHDTPPRYSTGVLLLTGKNIRADHIDFSEIEYVSEEDHKVIYERCNPEYGDVLYTNIGVNYGTAVINNLDYPFSMKNIALLKPNKDFVNGYYLWYVLNILRNKILDSNKTGGAQTFMALGTIKKIRIPVPKLDLQNDFAFFVQQIDKSKFEYTHIGVAA